MLAFDGLVRGRLNEPGGDFHVVVPRGRCRVEIQEGIVSLSWTADNGKAASVLLKADRLEQYLEEGAILIIDPAQLCSG